MQIYIVHKLVDREDVQETHLVSAHVDKLKADTAAQTIDHQGHDGVYGVVETVELDLTGAPTAVKVAIAQSHS
jgi:hypothetical protein